MTMYHYIAAALLAALLFLPATTYAGIGTGIGVIFPTGDISMHSVSFPTYSAFRHDRIIEELDVSEKSGKLVVEYRVTNDGDTPYTVDHRTGQVYDIAIIDKDNKALWRWSDGMAFTQALTSSTVAPHKTETYTAEVDKRTYRTFKDNATLVAATIVDTPYTIYAGVPTKSAFRRSPVLVQAGIAIGHGWYR